jgi:hypothetical protein
MSASVASVLEGEPVTGEPEFDELRGVRRAGAQPEQPLRAKLAPGLPPRLGEPARSGLLRDQRRTLKQRAVIRFAAATSIAAVFVSGYVVADHRSTKSAAPPPATVSLKGTLAAPRAHARVEVWRARAGNRPMRLSVVGLPKMPPRSYYEVFLIRRRASWAPCGRFRVTSSSKSLTLTLNVPYVWRKADSWVVTRESSVDNTRRIVLRSL